MTWILVAIIVIAIYNAERLPELMSRLKNEVPHLVDAGKKGFSGIKKKKAHAAQEKSCREKKLKNKKAR